jgi:hypothetical protein
MTTTIWIYFAMWLWPLDTLPPKGSLKLLETQAYYSEAECESAKKRASDKNASFTVCLPSTLK